MTDVQFAAWLNDLVVRLKVCAASLVVAFAVAAIPIPFLPYPTPAQKVIEIVAAPAAGHLQYPAPAEGLWTYWYVSIALSLVLAQPVLLWQILVRFALLDVPRRTLRLTRIVLLALGAFAAGGVVWLEVIAPAAIGFSLSGSQGVGIHWKYMEYMWTAVTFMFLLGFILEIPVLTFGVVWLRVVNRARLASYRPYAVLLAFILGAIITPSPDAINQAIIGIPTCLLFELGLLLARFVPTDDVSILAQPTISAT